MNLVIDFGNSRIKVGQFEKTELLEQFTFVDTDKFNEWILPLKFENVIISSVIHSSTDNFENIQCRGKKIVVSTSTSLPLTIRYSTPHTLGVDRIAVACGALNIAPQQNCLVIDFGTCINYEFVDEESNYHGGAISPGVNIRFQAMHTFTAKLPLIQFKDEVPLTGDSTETCMQSGVINGILAEVDGIIDRYKEKYPVMSVILCGGDALLFENKLKHRIFVAPNLVLSGLNMILLHNVGS